MIIVSCLSPITGSVELKSILIPYDRLAGLSKGSCNVYKCWLDAFDLV
jgi:hypothetical protein